MGKPKKHKPEDLNLEKVYQAFKQVNKKDWHNFDPKTLGLEKQLGLSFKILFKRLVYFF
jgi:hypothetical protein